MRAGEGPGPIALVGSGEYLESMADIEASLLAGRPRRYVQLATAAVPDGADVLARWHRLGAEAAERLDAVQVVLEVASRADAEDPALLGLLEDAGLIYLSGGHPGFLADTLRETALWHGIVSAWRSGSALAGCSAGAMALTTWVPSLRQPGSSGTAGLGLLENLSVIPHFNAFSRHFPQLVDEYLARGVEGTSILGIDEETALVGGPFDWVVRGRGSVWRLHAQGSEEFTEGATLATP